MEINVAITFDNNYIQHAIVLITSILENKTDENIHFHVLSENLSSKNKSILLDFKNCIIHFYKLDNKIFKNYKESNKYPVSILWKMILPEIIDVERLIYIDCDAVVTSSLRELWATKLDENYIAAVEDANGEKYVKKFKLNSKTKFFNSGMMLINCNKWKKDKIFSKALKISMKRSGTRWGYDQTILNQLFEGNVKFLDLKWNLQYCPINIWPTYKNLEEYNLAIQNPSIIHYVGDFKPWKKGLGIFNPKQNVYLKYLQKTVFAIEDYNKWKMEDNLHSYKGILAFIKRYPLFFLKKNYWIHKIITKRALKNNFSKPLNTDINAKRGSNYTLVDKEGAI